MGKDLAQQRRGKGSPRFISPSHRYIGKLGYENIPKGYTSGTVVDIVHSSGKYTPVAIVQFGNENALLIAAQNVRTGQEIKFGSVENGNITEVGSIPEGTTIFNVELRPGDGGKLCRSPGTFAKLVSHSNETSVIELPSKKQTSIPSKCLATIGVPAGFNRKDKPFMKAGKKFYAMRAFNRRWPLTKAVAKNAVDHPLGGKTKPGKPLTVSRHAPPGAKYGSLSPRRTGSRKKK